MITERDVRSLIKQIAPAAFWVEPGMGGSSGMPDCFLPIDGVLHPFELKIGDAVWKDGCTILSWKWRGAQIKVAQDMISQNVLLWILIGQKGTRGSLWMVPAHEALEWTSYSGNVKMSILGCRRTESWGDICALVRQDKN